MVDSFPSQKSKQKKTLIFLALLVILAFFAGRFGKQYYLRHSLWFDSVFSSFWTKSQTYPNEPVPSDPSLIILKNYPVWFLLDTGTRAQEILHGKTRQNHFLGALQQFSKQTPALSFEILRYPNTEYPTLKDLFQKILEKQSCPKHLILLTSELTAGDEDLPFEVIALTEKIPTLKISVVKSGSRHREQDARLFQIANEGGGALYWAETEDAIFLTFQYWLQSEILSPNTPQQK